MTEFKWTEEVEKSMDLHWDRCAQALHVDGICAIRHERDIPESYPAPLAEKCREIIRANRELEEGETRLIGSGRIVAMSVEGDYLCLNQLAYNEEMLRKEHQDKPERLAYLLKHRELKPNQVRFDDGEVAEMRMDGKLIRFGDTWCCVERVLADADFANALRWESGKSITGPVQRQRVRDFYERERRVESVAMDSKFSIEGTMWTRVPDRFDGRRVKVTFEDLGPIE